MLHEQGEASVRLDPAALESLLDRLDSREQAFRGPNRRQRPRLRYRGRTACVQFLEEAGVSKIFEAPTRNLSRGGLAFLHGGFVHTRVCCRLRLLSRHRKWVFFEGRVARCRYIDGRVHDIGVRFDREIELSLFIEDAELNSFEADRSGVGSAVARDAFREGLAAVAEEIVAAAGQGDWARVAQAARVLKGEARSFRLAVLAEAARRLEDAIITQRPPEVVRWLTGEVERACRAAAENPANRSEPGGRR